jgi:hypothetical protein
MKYETKIVLHIPLFRWDGEKLIRIDNSGVTQAIKKHFNDLGIKSWYCTDATGYYNGRSFKQELLTVYCDKTTEPRFIQLFKHVFCKSNDVLQQESFAYEVNNCLYVEKLK